ncbi:5766_t:CDS:2 [Paraglomus occultum]|uniref:5766_t:CDS:1 n=1 Tax=Paraglomus occultum TaxID=144539 RepID=A0A9N9CS85_9GLOM|nr:5766_t:CDS:2 [Paraglomus occultum]
MSLTFTPDRFDTQVNRLFSDFFRDFNVGRVGDTGPTKWRPLIDVHETDKEYVVNAELPGLKKEEINLDLHDNALTISGETKQDNKYKEGNTYVQERRYGNFSRTIALPNNIKADAVSAKFNDGVLEVVIPKAEHAQPKKVTIQ